jgi:hypothetical protein
MGIELKIQQMAIDGLPFTCPECDTSALTLDARGPIDALATVWATCSSFHSWEVYLLTLDDLKQIQAASTGRQRAEDEDAFAVVIGGALLEGTLHPDVILDDLKRAARDVYWKKIIKPAARRRKNAMKRAIKRPLRRASRAITQHADDTVAAAKAAAIGAAWTWQAGGHQPDPDYTPEPVNPCIACDGEGGHSIDSRIHGATNVPCLVCSGAGEID